jgi:hypothetical protein
MCHGRLVRWVLPVLLFLSPPAARAAFEIRSQSAVADAGRRQTAFTLTFNQPPDFTHTDGFGNPNEAFQYFFDTDPIPPDGIFAGDTVSIIRGPEIRFNDDIPIRDSLNPTGENFPHAEGWGQSRGAVGFVLAGDTIQFTVPWEMLHERDGKFSYVVQAYEQGSLTNEGSGLVIPLPPAGWSGALLGLPVAWRLVAGGRGRRGG